MEPINTDIDKFQDFIGSPIQNQEQNNTHKKVINLIDNDFLEKIWPIIFLKTILFILSYLIKY